MGFCVGVNQVLVSPPANTYGAAIDDAEDPIERRGRDKIEDTKSKAAKRPSDSDTITKEIVFSYESIERFRGKKSGLIIEMGSDSIPILQMKKI